MRNETSHGDQDEVQGEGADPTRAPARVESIETPSTAYHRNRYAAFFIVGVVIFWLGGRGTFTVPVAAVLGSLSILIGVYVRRMPVPDYQERLIFFEDGYRWEYQSVCNPKVYFSDIEEVVTLNQSVNPPGSPSIVVHRKGGEPEVILLGYFNEAKCRRAIEAFEEFVPQHVDRCDW